MDYQTLFNEAVRWVTSDVDQIAYLVIGGIVTTAVIGLFRSMRYAKVTGRCGRRVL